MLRAARAGILALGSWLAWAGCYDAGDRCDANMVLVEDARCVCAEGTILTSHGCEVAALTALGRSCDPAANTCSEVPYDHCQGGGATAYCTSTDCTASDECESGYACNTAGNPSFCQRPPIGLGQACAGPADCAGTEATWCDTFMTHQCVVQGCSVALQDCFGDGVCCDLSRFGVPAPLCVPPGAC
jgi:hypothetical protein